MVARMVREGVKACAAAFQLLTRLPVPVPTEGTEAEFRRSAVFYPVVGLAVGGIAAAGGWGLAWLLPDSVVAVLVVLLWTGLSGGLHLDGLMDTADGLFSHRSRERMLEIMKDSRAGPMGVMACVFALLLKVALVAALCDHGYAAMMAGVTMAAVLGRTFVPAAMARWPYARKEGGMGGLFRSVGKKHATLAWIMGLLAVLAVLVWPGGYGFAASLRHTVLGLAVAYGVGTALSSAVARKLGGLTGDVYGALIECLEIAALAGFVAVLTAGAG